MRAIFLAATAVATFLTLPRAFDEPLSGAVWLAALGLAVTAVLRGWPQVARAAVPAAAVLWLQVVVYPLPSGPWALGFLLGVLGSLLALGMALIYRANRVLNFAQAELGTAPTVFVVGAILFWHWNWYLAVTAGLAAAILLGIVVETAIIRRFRQAPRLVLTVATIGLSLLLTFVSILLPSWIWDRDIVTGDTDIPLPFKFRFEIGATTFRNDHLLAIVLVPIIVVALVAFMRFSPVGMAIRAAAERTDRAALLGIPVRRLQTVVWTLATVLSFIAVLLRAGILGLPVASTLSFSALLTALAALVLGDFTDLIAIGVASITLGILEYGVIWNNSNEPQLVAPVIAGVIVATLLIRWLVEWLRDVVRRSGTSRSLLDETVSWRSAEEVRPIPAELRRLPEVRAARLAGIALGLGFLVVLPLVTGPSTQVDATILACFVLIAASIVVLTGWAGQVTLGQMSFVAAGAATGAVVTSEWRLDFSLALLVAGAAGAALAVVVGLPAIRLRGPFLAVTTLAFAVASSQYFLNRSQFGWIPSDRIERPQIFAVIDMNSQEAMYYVTVAVVLLGLVIVRGVRSSRTGRVLLASRDNEAAARAYGVRVMRVKLSAFALSGFMAGVAGCLHVHTLLRYGEQPYEPAVSFAVFTAAVVGGLGSLTGAVLGALFLNGGQWFLPADWQLLPSAAGVLVILLVLPGGLGQLVFRGRDAVLRRIAERRDIVVPSLVADVRTDERDDVAALAAAAEDVPSGVADEAAKEAAVT